MKKRVIGLEIETAGKFIDPNGAISTDEEARVRAVEFIQVLREKFGNFNNEISPNTSDEAVRAILPNQGQAYIDRHNIIELCTPECSSLSDLLLHKRVTQAIIVSELRKFNRRIRELSKNTRAGLHLFARTTDAFRENTLSCHENYQGKGYDHNCVDMAKQVLIPFLMARKILEGSGSFYYRNTKPVTYQNTKGRNFLSFGISQRIPFIETLFSNNSRSNRPFIREQHSSLATDEDKRWEILSGESNQTPFCDFIKAGSVQLLLEMVEEGYFFDKTLPFTGNIETEEGKIGVKDFTDKMNSDLRCQAVYKFGPRRARLYEILQVYAGWMLDYLTGGSYYGPEQKDGLYREKLAVAKGIIWAADCFERGDIFALDQDVEWVMKLRWMQDFIEDEAGIKIGDDEIESWDILTNTLANRRTPRTPRLKELEKMIIYRDSFWHNIDPEMSYYSILEDCGLVNPVIIGGRAVDLSKEVISANMNKTPMNPPNRSLARKMLWDFVQKAGLSDFLSTRWTRCETAHSKEKIGMKQYIRLLEMGAQVGSDIEKDFPWGHVIQFEDPQIGNYSEVVSLIKYLATIVNRSFKED